jgi:Pyroglutamyl peptidase
MTRILITGFGPFPGAPSNPTMAIVRHLLRARHQRFAGVELLGRFLPTEWGVLPGFAQTIRQCKPDAILMFGLAGRRRKITPEARAINHANLLRTDADGGNPKMRQLTPWWSSVSRKHDQSRVVDGPHARGWSVGQGLSRCGGLSLQRAALDCAGERRALDFRACAAAKADDAEEGFAEADATDAGRFEAGRGGCTGGGAGGVAQRPERAVRLNS